MTLLLDQAAKLSWVSMTQTRTVQPGVKIAHENHSRDFESVRNAIVYTMEKLEPANRVSAMILVDQGPTLQIADIEAMYKSIKASS